MPNTQLPPSGQFAFLKTLAFARGHIEVLRDCARELGRAFTLPTNFGPLVLTGDPEGIKEIFTADPDTFKPFGTVPLEPIVGPNSMLLLSGARHKRERKLLMPPFHGERMRAYGQIMQSTAITAVRAESTPPLRPITTCATTAPIRSITRRRITSLIPPNLLPLPMAT